MSNNKEFDVEITPNGEIRFRRKDPAYNDSLLSFLRGLVDSSKIQELEGFFSVSENVEVLFGENLCG